MTELVVVSAEDRAGLAAEIARLVGYLDRAPETRLTDVAYTTACTHGRERLAIVADSVADLRARLASAAPRVASETARRIRDKGGTYYFRDHLLGEGGGKLAFLFPGVMSFYPDMMRDLAITYPECRSAFDDLEEALAGDIAFTPSSFIFPPAPRYRHDADIFSSGAYAQALVSTFAACTASFRLLSAFGLTADGAIGFAGGDLAAMIYAGVAGDNPSRSSRLGILRDIYTIVDKAINHSGLPRTNVYTVLLRREADAEAKLREALSELPKDKVCEAIDLSPRQKVYVVDPSVETDALDAFARAGARSMKMALDRPFNTPACDALEAAVRKFASHWMTRDPACALYSCATTEPLPPKVRAVRKDMAQRWTQPVRFADTVRRLYADGYRVFLEVGPRGLMTANVEDTLHDQSHAAIAMNSIHRSGRLQLLHAVAQLIALGAELDSTSDFLRRGARKLDFDAAVSPELRRRESEMLLSRRFPRLTLLTSGQNALREAEYLSEPKGRGAKAAQRAAAVAATARRQRQFDFGTMNPLISDADTVESCPGVSIELKKTFRLSEAPFIGDFAIGTSQLSYADPNLRGLVLLTLPVAAEIMAETANMLVPGRVLVEMDDLVSKRSVAFKQGALTVYIRAERIASGDPSRAAVKVRMRPDAPDAAFTQPILEATFLLDKDYGNATPAPLDPLTRPRTVHWSGREVYPSRLYGGKRLRGISFVESWSESGLDYVVTVPPLADNVTFTRFPIWTINPLLLGAIASGYALWRSHERFKGAFSFPFRLRRLELHAAAPAEGVQINCYLRLTGVTPRSHLCDITVSDGDGGLLMALTGWEEYAEHVGSEYRAMILQPATSFITRTLEPAFIGAPQADVSTAYVTDVPYAIFERDEELWLKTFSCIVLSAAERREFATKSGSAPRRTEWLFGRIAAKEAVRRYLKDFHQARWSDADVTLYADDLGKPHAIGAWNDYLHARLDIAIAHTAQFVVAIAAANMRVGVDVESSARDLSEEFTRGVFTPEELERAAQAVNAAQAVIRFWCAKEAVSKALGTGIRYSPKEMTVVSYRADTGTLAIRLEGGWVEAFRRFRGRDITVTVRNLNEHALAFCFIPESMFEEPN